MSGILTVALNRSVTGLNSINRSRFLLNSAMVSHSAPINRLMNQQNSR